MLEIAQAPVDQLGGGGRRAGGEVALLDQEDAQSPAGRVARDTDAVDAAAHDGKIEIRHGRVLGPLASQSAPFRDSLCSAIHSQRAGERLASGRPWAMMHRNL
jgi:hypothetical protein